MAHTLEAADPPAPQRLTSLDLWRGVVMVLMAIDHVRVYSGVPAGGPTAGVFFTRWMTHFCAPAFVFLAGTSAYLHGQSLGRSGSPTAARRALARYLVTRGALLVLLELTVIRLAWTFTTASLSAPLAGVIWMLGWCMILLSALIRLPTTAIGIIGFAIIFAQDLVGRGAQALPPSLQWIGQFLYTGGEVTLGQGGPSISVLYSVLPWLGVMAAGYAFGAVVTREPRERRRLCLRIGLAATGLFLAGAAVVTFAGPAPEQPEPLVFRLLNQRKYPASQLYLLMTLGPAIALLPAAERARGPIANLLVTFGRVPMFYYLLHIPVIHVLALGAWLARDGRFDAAWFASAPYVFIPPAERWGLPLLYLVFVVSIAVLYVPCRWFAALKGRRRDRWLRYL